MVSSAFNITSEKSIPLGIKYVLILPMDFHKLEEKITFVPSLLPIIIFSNIMLFD